MSVSTFGTFRCGRKRYLGGTSLLRIADGGIYASYELTMMQIHQIFVQPYAYQYYFYFLNYPRMTSCSVQSRPCATNLSYIR